MKVYKKIAVFGSVAALFFTLFFGVAFAQVIDTCPGNDGSIPYTCADIDNLTCTDISSGGSQYQIVTCYPPDYYGNINDFCSENRSDGCGNGRDDLYTCLPNESRSCFDITDRDNGNNCGSWAFSFESEGRNIICYPDDDVYGGFQPTPQFPSTIGSYAYSDGTRSDARLCPNGEYVAGVTITSGGSGNDMQYTQIHCAPAPRGYLGVSCLADGTCNFNYVCN